MFEHGTPTRPGPGYQSDDFFGTLLAPGGHQMASRTLSLLCATALSCLLAGGAAAGVAVGDAAPQFSLPGSDGASHSLEQYRGKQAVVLAWFPKAFTGG